MRAVKTMGTALSPDAVKVLLLGSGELGKEVIIALQRLGIETIAADRYNGAPAQQVAHRAYTLDMQDAAALRALIEAERPDYIVPEIEALNTGLLAEMEQEGFKVVPTAHAVQLTMNREGIRRLAAEDLKLDTSPYRFAETFSDMQDAVAAIGFPCVVKPVMSSSGRGQSVLRGPEDILAAWDYAQEGGRAGGGRVIVEGFVDFDYEITLLTVRHAGGTTFLAPVGHRQENGDYRESWQPCAMSPVALKNAEAAAGAVTAALGGFGVFGVELFVKGDDVIFNEVSPRPHDTGLVTLISQDLSEFDLHARAFLGLPVPAEVPLLSAAASKAVVAEGDSENIRFDGVAEVLAEEGTDIRLFGKKELHGHRRLGVVLAKADTAEAALEKAERASEKLSVLL